MANRISNSEKRRREILKRASTEFGCSLNNKWAFASMQEPAVKSLIRKGLVKVNRTAARGSNKRTTYLTPE
jgi:hypothetical protein